MPDPTPAPVVPIYSSGDVLVAQSEDGSYQVARVSANGRASHVMGCQRTQPAALSMAARATSGTQRVYLRPDRGLEYRLVDPE